MTTIVNRKADFLQNESIRIDSNRELECSTLQSLCAIFSLKGGKTPYISRTST